MFPRDLLKWEKHCSVAFAAGWVYMPGRQGGPEGHHLISAFLLTSEERSLSGMVWRFLPWCTAFTRFHKQTTVMINHYKGCFVKDLNPKLSK